ncbi:MAG: hypothetical protein LKH74_01855 [Levilactobacillus sp.]|jgi:hypothetical protein|uniref:hypothetical protein n=1 Tax=Levilactobacillus sp. TaxID=2767919 RepID=UPI0025898D94|nr:hypothetical protein [Levilactobacillus sp.]MCH4123207.1 hypothetical protein [Levilactobacillus sp.]MCI1552655.1 hypothetical protein [Levilactobacillus sp.]MCI1599758.1 hypothetical protein [Levilactobacillus sp.]MCI1606380.1 hypothetical protein [Levilactobacillus sp.]
MFLGIAILGAIFIVITFFSVINAGRRGESRRGPLIVLVLTILVTAGAIWKLPYWSADHHHSDQSAASSVSKTSSLSSQSGQAFASSTPTMTQAEAEKQVAQQLAKSLKKLGPVTFDKASKTYTLTITNTNLKKTIKGLHADPSQAKQAKWPKFAHNFIQTSASLKKALGKGYSLVFRVGHQSPVLVYKDGYLTKNQFE